MKAEPHLFPGVFDIKDKDRTSISTRSLVENQSVYGEKIVRLDDGQYRLWSPRRSKLAAAILKGIREMPIQPGSKVVYLGAASGTTVSHVSDIVGEDGVVYAVEFSPQVSRKLIQLADTRPNIVPIIADARHPSRFGAFVGGPVDVVYQDVAQSEQARILVDNLKHFCSFGSWGMIAIKARSIDSASGVDQIYSREIGILDSHGLEVVENVKLDPLEKDHRFVVCRVTEDIR
ncbi:MAG: fibrillarin-like rRNA/tRNA 2'-O-methyltransferase [Candidatus Thorarchaeota archaeon]